MQEIERKFLVKNNDFKALSTTSLCIKQGYLNSNPNRAVRIRIQDYTSFITIKGISDSTGASRFEWEKEIPQNEALQLLGLCEPQIISKTRYIVPFSGNLWEVDVFEGNHQGLKLAELELKDINQTFEIPNWIGEEVTGNKKYYNTYLSKHPFDKDF